MNHGQGTRNNADVHRALSIVQQYNTSQEVDEAPYSAWSNVKDTARQAATLGFGGGARMAKGRKESGKLANQLNKQWQYIMGKKGFKDANQATIGDLKGYISNVAPNVKAEPFFAKAKVEGNDETPLPSTMQDQILLSVAQGLNQAGYTALGADGKAVTGAVADEPTGQEPAQDTASGGGGSGGGLANFAKQATDARGQQGDVDININQRQHQGIDTRGPTGQQQQVPPTTGETPPAIPDKFQAKGTDGNTYVWQQTNNQWVNINGSLPVEAGTPIHIELTNTATASIQDQQVPDGEQVPKGKETSDPELDGKQGDSETDEQPPSETKQAELINFVASLDPDRQTAIGNAISDLAGEQALHLRKAGRGPSFKKKTPPSLKDRITTQVQQSQTG